MMKLYCFPRSGNSREVKLVLEAKGIPYERINIHAEGFDKNSPEFRKASPKGKVPAIIDNGTYLSEAYEVNIYLEDKYPQNPLLSKEPEARKAIREWVASFDKKLVLKIGLLIIECLLKPKDRQKEDLKVKLRDEIRKGLEEVDRALEGKDYLFGNYSLADIAITPHITALPRVGFEVPAEFKNLKGWLERIEARPNFAASAN